MMTWNDDEEEEEEEEDDDADWADHSLVFQKTKAEGAAEKAAAASLATIDPRAAR